MIPLTTKFAVLDKPGEQPKKDAGVVVSLPALDPAVPITYDQIAEVYNRCVSIMDTDRVLIRSASTSCANFAMIAAIVTAYARIDLKRAVEFMERSLKWTRPRPERLLDAQAFVDRQIEWRARWVGMPVSAEVAL